MQGCLEQWKTMKAISEMFEIPKGSVLKAFVSCSFPLGQKSPTLFSYAGVGIMASLTYPSHLTLST